METIGSFLMDQVLKMQWLSELITSMLASIGIDVASRWGGSLQFFLYDTIKIVILLCVMIFLSVTFKASFHQSEVNAFLDTSKE